MMQKQIPASSSLVHLFKGFHGGKCKFHVDDVTFFLEHMSPMVTMFSKVTGWDLLSLMARPAEASGALLTDNVLSGLGTDVSNLPRVGNHVSRLTPVEIRMRIRGMATLPSWARARTRAGERANRLEVERNMAVEKYNQLNYNCKKHIDECLTEAM